MVNQEGNPYLADLGLATVRHRSASKKSILEHGSTRWMAPELFVNTGDTIDLEDDIPIFKATRYSDIWSFAMLILELLTGEVPFPEKNSEASVRSALVNGERPKHSRNLKVTEDGLNDELWQILLRCWESLPENRLPLQSLQNALDRLAIWRSADQTLSMCWHYCSSRCRQLRYLMLQDADTLQPPLLSTFLGLQSTTRIVQMQMPGTITTMRSALLVNITATVFLKVSTDVYRGFCCRHSRGYYTDTSSSEPTITVTARGRPESSGRVVSQTGR